MDKKPCEVEVCTRFAYHGKTMCNTHGQRFERYGDPHYRKKLANGEQTPERFRENARRAWKRYINTPHGRLRRRFDNAKRRVRKFGGEYEAGVPKEAFLELLKQKNCVLCGKPMRENDKTLDHKIPLSKGGTNSIGNLQLAHSRCNKQKGCKTDP